MNKKVDDLLVLLCVPLRFRVMQLFFFIFFITTMSKCIPLSTIKPRVHTVVPECDFILILYSSAEISREKT